MKLVCRNLLNLFFYNCTIICYLATAGQQPEITEGEETPSSSEFEDSQKIKVPDPSIAEDDGEVPPVKTADAPAEIIGETLIEGAWADILGSGHLKKKVLYILTTFLVSI